MPQRHPHLSHTRREDLYRSVWLSATTAVQRAWALKSVPFSAVSQCTLQLAVGELEMGFCMHQKVKYNCNTTCQYRYKDFPLSKQSHEILASERAYETRGLFKKSKTLHWATKLAFSYFSTFVISSVIESYWWGEVLIAA